MFKEKVWDSREIEDEDWKKLLGDDYDDVEYILNGGDMMNIPDIDVRTLRKFSGSYIIGGGRDEYLAEVQLLMSAFNIRATEIKRYIY